MGQRVAVIGAGGIGFDVAEFLTHSDSAGDDSAGSGPSGSGSGRALQR